jgi:hypothetical protein
MKYAVEMGPGDVMHVLSFIKIDSGIQKLGGGGDTQHGDLKSQHLFLAYFPYFEKNSSSLARVRKCSGA